MEIILLESVSHLGGVGDLVRVKSGYARNFLLPSGKALRATKANRERFEREKAALERLNKEKRDAAEKEAGALRGKHITLVRPAGETGQLYGSVTGRDIVTACAEEAITLSRNQIVLDRPLKTLGKHEVLLRLHPEIEFAISVEVKRSAAEESLLIDESEEEDAAQEEEDAGQEAQKNEEAADSEEKKE